MSRSQTFSCFGLVIHGLSLDEAIHRSMGHGSPCMVVTANPEILLQAKRDPSYWNCLRQADLRLVDGFGLQLIGWVKGARPARVSGVAFAEGLLQAAIQKNWSIAFLGGTNGSADKAAWQIRKTYPGLRIFAEQGGVVGKDGSMDEAGNEALFRLTQQAPDILLLAFGHPKQEQWLVRHMAQLPSVKIGVGVGGTFDYWSGKVKRAPRILQGLGLEWLWRLFVQPTRLKRIWDAVIVFPWTVLREGAKKIPHEKRLS